MFKTLSAMVQYWCNIGAIAPRVTVWCNGATAYIYIGGCIALHPCTILFSLEKIIILFF
jgi:hypothetical protein